MLEERFTYTVHPRKPIKNIVKGKAIVRPTNLALTKSEVLQCMKCGAVYRKFYLESDLERVTPSNLDRLHRSDHIGEAEYKVVKERESKEVASGLANDSSLGVVLPPQDEEVVDKPEEATTEDSEPEQEESNNESPTSEPNNEIGEEPKKEVEEQLSTDDQSSSIEPIESEGINDEESEEMESTPENEDVEDNEESDSDVQDEEPTDSVDTSNNTSVHKSGKRRNKRKKNTVQSVPETTE